MWNFCEIPQAYCGGFPGNVEMLKRSTEVQKYRNTEVQKDQDDHVEK